MEDLSLVKEYQINFTNDAKVKTKILKLEVKNKKVGRSRSKTEGLKSQTMDSTEMHLE